MDQVGRLRLAPGLRVVRRGRHHLQVGLYDGRRVVLPRTPVVEGTLATLLDHGPADPDPAGDEALDLLQRHGCLVSEDDHARRERRGRSRVALLGDVAEARELLSAAAVTVVGAGVDAEVALLVTHGEVDRTLLDPLIRRGTSHVVVRLVDGAALVGPFVSPGRTACLRCIDAQLSIGDPDHVAVTSRYVRATSHPREDGATDNSDPVLATLALAWAVRDVVAHLDGRRPALWSRTLFLDPDPARGGVQDWSRHPECGCCWSAHAPLSGTMGV
ncbi:MAG: TOMM precursor leader peptide-binding protein [Marmoricola sp.]